VSVFRPSTRATSPDGREWEIYAYKIQVRDRPEWDTEAVDPLAGGVGGARAGFMLLNLVVDLVLLVPRGLARLFDVTVAALLSLRSDEWTIEAVTWLPQKHSYAWTTTREYRGQVLAQVEGSLTRGDVPRYLGHATYRGMSRSAR
jgi:hypothetical protein